MILSKLQQQERPLSDNMIKNQGNLESLLMRDKKCRQHQWLSYKRRQSANNAVEYLDETGNIKELPHQTVKWKRLCSKGFNKAVDNSNQFTLFEKGNKPTRCN